MTTNEKFWQERRVISLAAAEIDLVKSRIFFLLSLQSTMSARTALNTIKLAARQAPKGQRAYSLLTGAKAAAAVAPRTATLTVSFFFFITSPSPPQRLIRLGPIGYPWCQDS